LFPLASPVRARHALRASRAGGRPLAPGGPTGLPLTADRAAADGRPDCPWRAGPA